MYKLRFLTVVSMILFLICCNKKAVMDIPKEKNNQQASDFTMNNRLSTKEFESLTSYKPKEGFVPTAQVAVTIADVVLSNIYGKDNIDAQKPFSVNLENDIWLIEGHIEQGYLGGVAYMEIRKSNGEILKVIHGK